jgi:hypothetical protein
MHWNHRVVRRVYKYEIEYSIHEAYYGLNKDDKPSITTESIAPYGESMAELRETLQRMLKALDKPVLDYETREEIK